MDGWQHASLGGLVDLTLSSVDKKSKASETPVLLCNYTDVYKNTFIHVDMDFMPATATDREIANCYLQTGDVLITKDSETHDDIGVPAYVKDDIPNLLCGYHLAILRPVRDLLDGCYLYYALSTQAAQQQFHALANGVTRFGLRKDDIGRVEIPLPPLPEQRRIAHVLGALDDKIELNRRMAETLDAMARALFRSWFVDFEPVRAKLDGRWRPGHSLPGLPADHYPLFPDTLAPSPLGHIPDGWQVRPLGDVVELHDSKRIPLNSRQRAERQGPYPYYGAAGIMDYVDDYLFDGVYVLVGEDGSVVDEEGYPVVQYVWGQFWVNNHAHVLRAKDGVGLEQLYLFLKQTNIVPYVTGAVQPKLNQANLTDVPFLLPTPAVCSAFAEVAGPLFEQVRSKVDESRALAAQRDALLPGLMAGEIGVGSI